MAEYIEREALMKYPIRIDHYDKENGNEHFVLGIESVLEFAEHLPAADVAPVVHRRWELVTTKYAAAQYVRVGYCQNCNAERLVDNYCPNCGAKMDAENVVEMDGLEEHA